MPIGGFTGVKVFSATKARDRETLGDRITAWLRKEPIEIVHVEIRQSSDMEFHCLTFVLSYNKADPRRAG